jgi:hypothetical protein
LHQNHPCRRERIHTISNDRQERVAVTILPQGAAVSQPPGRFGLLRTKAGAAATRNPFSLAAEKVVTGQIGGRSLDTEAQKAHSKTTN